MTIIPLHEGVYAVDNQKNFTLTSKEEKLPGLIMGICPFLIDGADGLTLLDAGIRREQNGQPLIVALIEQAGYSATDVKRVLLSHLHKDHVDGIGTLSADGLSLHFPNATVYIQQREFDLALTQGDTPSYHLPLLEALGSLPHVEWMQEDEGAITPSISFTVTGGHSPFHQVFWIKEDGQTAFYGADNLPQISYLKPHIAYKTDFDGKHAMELRQAWEKQAKEEQWDVLFYHGVRTTISKLS